MKTLKVTLLNLTLVAGFAHADMLGIYAGVEGWQHNGDIKIIDANQVLPSQAFNYDTKTDVSAYIKFEHPIPLIPNVAVRHTSLNLNATGNLDALYINNKLLAGKINLNGENFVANDATAYYKILDNVVSVDLGLTARQLKGDVIATDSFNQTATLKINQTIPMGYAAAEVTLPFTGLSANAELSGVSYNGSKITDAKAELKYKVIDNVAMDVSAKLGYRQLNIKLSDVDQVNAETTIKGAYAGVEVHF